MARLGARRSGTIISYIADRNVPAAERLQAAIEACADALPDHPRLYRPGRVPGTHEAVVHPNHILINSVAIETIEVVAVVHSRPQYP